MTENASFFEYYKPMSIELGQHLSAAWPFCLSTQGEKIMKFIHENSDQQNMPEYIKFEFYSIINNSTIYRISLTDCFWPGL